jgi:hypothetical protein
VGSSEQTGPARYLAVEPEVEVEAEPEVEVEAEVG